MLLRVGLVGLVCSAAGCLLDPLGIFNGDGDCVDHLNKTFNVTTPANPPTQLRIDSCRVDVDACTSLCAIVLQDADIEGTTTKCEVTFIGERVKLEVAYDVFDNSGNCGVADDVAPTAGIK